MRRDKPVADMKKEMKDIEKDIYETVPSNDKSTFDSDKFLREANVQGDKLLRDLGVGVKKKK